MVDNTILVWYHPLMKTCSKCKEAKPLGEFYAHPETADGLLGKCKECKREDQRANRAAKIDFYRESDARRYQEDPRVRQRQRRYLATDAGKASRRKCSLKYLAANQDKRAAHKILENAVRGGRISKPDECSKCGAGGRIHGHHEDYALPLAVVWVCAQCHVNIHKELY